MYRSTFQDKSTLEEFWRTWSFLTGRLEQLHEEGMITMSVFEDDRRKAAIPAVQGARGTASRNYRTAVEALERYLEFFGPGNGDGVLSMLEDLGDLFEQSAANGTPIREVVERTPWSSPSVSSELPEKVQWISRERERLTNAIDRVAGNDA